MPLGLISSSLIATSCSVASTTNSSTNNYPSENGDSGNSNAQKPSLDNNPKILQANLNVIQAKAIESYKSNDLSFFNQYKETYKTKLEEMTTTWSFDKLSYFMDEVINPLKINLNDLNSNFRKVKNTEQLQLTIDLIPLLFTTLPYQLDMLSYYWTIYSYTLGLTENNGWSYLNDFYKDPIKKEYNHHFNSIVKKIYNILNQEVVSPDGINYKSNSNNPLFNDVVFNTSFATSLAMANDTTLDSNTKNSEKIIFDSLNEILNKIFLKNNNFMMTINNLLRTNTDFIEYWNSLNYA